MKKDPDRIKGRTSPVTAVRHDEHSALRLDEILTDNPLYSPSSVLRGAILALYEMSREQRMAIIVKAATH